MLDDFFVRALLAGVGLAVVCGPFGCFIVWRRMSYFGDTLAHSALLGVALGFWLQTDITLAVFGTCAVVAISLFLLERVGTLSVDSLLGILSHSSLALGLVSLSLMPWVRFDLTGLLFGDILSVDQTDLWIILCGGVVLLMGIGMIWRPLFAVTVSPEIAEAEMPGVTRARILFILLMAGLIALSMKIVGVLLITALLIIPAASARRFATGPEVMLFLASGVGVVAVVIGLEASLWFDTPAGPSIVVACAALFAGALTVSSVGTRLIRSRSGGLHD